MGPADLLGIVWESAPSGIEPHPWTQLVGGSIEHGSHRSEVDEIESSVPDAAPEQLPSLTKIPSVPAVLVIEQHIKRYGPGPNDFTSGGTEVVLGPVANRLAELGADKLDPRQIADAGQVLTETGDVSQVEALFASTEYSKAATRNPDQTTAAAPRHGRPRRNTRKADGREDTPTANVVNPMGFGNLFATPPLSRLSAYDGLFGPDIVAVNGFARGRNRFTRGGNFGGDSPGSGRNRRELEMLDEGKVWALLQRSPRGSVPRVAVPAELRNRITEWRAVLAESEPLMAILQLILASDRRDEDADFDQPLTGVPLWHELILAAFGYPSRQAAYKDGVNAGMLLELFCRFVDSDFAWTGYSEQNGKARLVKSHSIPEDIVEEAKEWMIGDKDWELLISGKTANRDNFGPLREERRERVKEQKPLIEPPEYTRRIQGYLHDLDEVNTFSHGSHGAFRPDVIDEAISTLGEKLEDRQRKMQERMKLLRIRQYPMPLYPFCDRFPRLKADRWNQAMNLPSEILRCMYGTRDVELDLSKAHLGSYVPVAKREGLDVPILERYLHANLEDDTGLLEEGDLWLDLASYLDVEGPKKAKRKTVKRAYSIVYGKEEKGLPYQLLKEFAELTGHWEDTTEPFEKVLSHPLMEELLQTRDELERIINDRGGLDDADGRFIPLDKWNGTKKKSNRWRGVMAYVNATYEQKLMAAPFEEARKEKEREGNNRFWIWLYQADGFTMRTRSDASSQRQIQRLQDAVAEKANELGVPTELEVDWPE